jgi:hypothetical protein
MFSLIGYVDMHYVGVDVFETIHRDRRYVRTIFKNIKQIGVSSKHTSGRNENYRNLLHIRSVLK